MVDQVSRDNDLLDTARDCFNFVTRFFEPIDVSATHIYHSALELSPLSSVVRRLYHHQQRISSPRVVAGISNSWSQCINLPVTVNRQKFHTWSPCGRFIAIPAGQAVKICDALSSELVSTFTKSGGFFGPGLAYSQDGHSLASLTYTGVVIWDIQTGGVAKEIPCDWVAPIFLVWSLDGGSICVMA